MKRPAMFLTTLAASLLLLSCTQAAPPATPTKAPVAQSAAAPTAQPTAAPVAQPSPQPTIAPVKKVDFPVKGKPITLIIPWPAGGPADAGARILAAPLEKDLGVPVQIVNVGGAGSQVGLAQLAAEKPDGYTIGQVTTPNMHTFYLDPERKSTFDRKSFQPVSGHIDEPGGIAVKADSKYKTIKDLLDAAKAEPEKVKMAISGLLGGGHLQVLQMQKLTGAKFANVVFDGGAPAIASLLGGHTDAESATVSNFLPQVKNNEVRVLGIAAKEQSQFLPGVKTFDSEGLNMYYSLGRAWAVPAGTPKEVVDILSAAFKKALADPVVQKQALEAGQALRYEDPATMGARWADMEPQVKELMALANQE